MKSGRILLKCQKFKYMKRILYVEIIERLHFEQVLTEFLEPIKVQ